MSKLKPFTMPKWGIEMSEGTVAEWMVAENVPFARGTVLALIETDKITNEIEAEAPGRLVRVIAQAGETYAVGALLGVMSDGAEAGAAEIDAIVAAFIPADTSFGDAPAAPALATVMVIPDTLAISATARARALAEAADVAQISGSGRNGRITAQDVDQALRAPVQPALVGSFAPSPLSAVPASPMARRLAALHGVSFDGLVGTGPRGRISKADVLARVAAPPVVAATSVPKATPASAESKPVAAASTPPAAGVEVVPMSATRRTIARRMTEAKATIPHFYVRRRVRADRLLALRAAATGVRPTINDYLVKACALALIEVPQLNIQVHGADIHHFASAEIAVAVATEKGLMMPVVTGADSRSVAEIAAMMAGLAQRARTGKLKAEEISGGSFSLSNLGGYGVEQFDAIINPPQGAILAVGAARPEPIDDDGALRIVPVMHLSLSCDHRAIDGADGGRFLMALARLIEQPALLD